MTIAAQARTQPISGAKRKPLMSSNQMAWGRVLRCLLYCLAQDANRSATWLRRLDEIGKRLYRETSNASVLHSQSSRR
jgi:hypothetical protein